MAIRLFSEYLGVTKGGAPLRAYLQLEDFDFSSKKTRVLVVGGFGGIESDVRDERIVASYVPHYWSTI